MSRKFIKGGVIGFIIGAIGGLLLAPKSGKETRDNIRAGVGNAMSESEKELKRIYKDLQTKADEYAKITEAFKGRAQTEANKALDSVEDILDRIREQISDIHEGDEVDQDELARVVKKAKSMSKKMETKAKQSKKKTKKRTKGGAKSAKTRAKKTSR